MSRSMTSIAASIMGAALLLLAGAPAPAEARGTTERLILAQSTDGVLPNPLRQPSEAEQVRLVDEAMMIFVESLKAKSMEAFYEHASNAIRKEIPLAKLNEAFRDMMAVDIRGNPLERLSPIFSKPSAIQGGTMVIEGYYLTQPQNLHFRLVFVREGLSWRWASINTRVAPATEQATAKPSS